MINSFATALQCYLTMRSLALHTPPYRGCERVEEESCTLVRHPVAP